MHVPAAKDVHFDVDKSLNRFIPRSRVHRLPKPIAHFLGYRAKPRKELGSVIIAAWSFIGAFCGVAIIEGVFMTPSIRAHGAPLIIGSFVRELSGSGEHAVDCLIRAQRPFSNIILSKARWHSLETPYSDTFFLLLLVSALLNSSN